MNDFKVGDDVIIKKTNELGRVVDICTDGYLLIEVHWRLLLTDLIKLEA